MKIKVFGIVLILLLIFLAIIVSGVMATEFTPQGNINLRDVYNISGVPSIMMAYGRYANISIEDPGGFFTTDEIEYALQALAAATGGAVSANTTWKDPVINLSLADPPDSPSTGDRFIISGASAWYDFSWKYRKLLTIDSTYVYDDETNYPVRVNFTGQNIIFEHALANGSDILFTLSDGETKLDADKEFHSGNLNVSNFWVEIPSLSSSANTSFYVYYGNPGALNNTQIHLKRGILITV